MSLLDRVRACNTWQPEDFRPWVIDGQVLGRIRHDFALRLKDFPTVFAVGDAGVTLRPGLDSVEGRSAALAEVIEALVAAGEIAAWRGEPYAVTRRFGEGPALVVDRGAAAFFGIRSFAVHMNGFVESPEGLRLWVAKRAKDRQKAPGKLDHLVAGGQPYGLSLEENLVKEGHEEAGLTAAQVAGAQPAGAVSYRFAAADGLRDDFLFCFDLVLPAEFQPLNRDGEVESFHLWPLSTVIEMMREGEAFKFNVPLVVIHFLVRRGFLRPDDPDYQAILEGLWVGD